MENMDNAKGNVDKLWNQFEDNFDHVRNEEDVRGFFEEAQVYMKQRLKHTGGTKFMFTDGPPFVSGTLHMGHVLVSTIKSAFLNWLAMNGYDVSNKLGFDTHGLPIEQLVTKKLIEEGRLTFGTRQEIMNTLGVEEFNRICKETIDGLAHSWKPIFDELGRFVDYENIYMTKDTKFMESCFWAFKNMWDKGLIYRGHNVMHFSPSLSTPLSNFEAKQNYKTINDRSIFVKFKVVESDIVEFENLYFVAWTTTPWTLPSNISLCVSSNDKVEYCVIYDVETNHHYIMAKEAIGNMYPSNKKDKAGKDKKYEIVRDGLVGKDLVGVKYTPLYNCFDDANDGFFRVISAHFVTADSGTGIVHMAPAFGADDFTACCEFGIVSEKDIGEYCPIDDEGKFTDKIPELNGMYFKDADTPVIINLKESGNWIKTMQYEHEYPFCWRTDTPLIYMVRQSFFIDVPQLKEKLVANNAKTTWVPENIGTGRFNNWLQQPKPWCVSRNRVFGTPIPVWVSYDGCEMVCVGSIEELVRLTGCAGKIEEVTDLHPEFVKNLVIPSNEGRGDLRWCGEVLDCWFESGCVPFAQHHYPFENPDMFEGREFGSDFIAEGLDQTRGWFYTLNVISEGVLGIPAFKKVICTGLILANDGKKISKSAGNFVDPRTLFKEYGCDAIRLLLLSSPATQAGESQFDIEDVKDTSGKLVQLRNVYKFFIEHAIRFKEDGYEFGERDYMNSKNVMDQWILTRLGSVIRNINATMENMKINCVYQELQVFFEDLANWYVKFNRTRMKGMNITREEQSECLSTCWFVLLTLSKVLAPFCPFISETFYQKMKVNSSEKDIESVHLSLYPDSSMFPSDPNIERRMINLQEISRTVRFMRGSSENHRSVKTPIKEIRIFGTMELVSDIQLIERYLTTEINCLNVVYNDIESGTIFKLEPNHKTIGKTFRRDGSTVKRLIAKIHSSIAKEFVENESYEFELVDENDDDKKYVINTSHVFVKCQSSYQPTNTQVVKVENDYMIVCEFAYDEIVNEMSIKSELACEIQLSRKQTHLRPWNEIKICYYCNDPIFNKIIQKYIKDVVDIVTFYPHNDPNDEIERLSNESGEHIIISRRVTIKARDSYDVKITIIDVTGEYVNAYPDEETIVV
jgi:isoleucyl-tRNA synthetase